MEEEPKVWTSQNDSNGNETNISRVSTASAKQKPKNNNDNPYLVGVQSRFRRKNYHKTFFLILILIIVVLLTGLIVLIFYAKYYTKPCETKDCLRAASNLLQSMDMSVDPCDDFYQFTCGNWAEEHPKPDSSNSFDWFSEKQNKVLRTIRSFLRANGSDGEPDAVNQARIMYKACMNTEKMDTLGLRPLLNYLELYGLPQIPTTLKDFAETNKTSTQFNWIQSIARIKRYFGADIIIGFDIFPDPKNRSRNRIVLGTPESSSILPFKTDFDKKVEKITRKSLIDSDVFDVFFGREEFTETEDDGSGEEELEGDAVSAYTSYVTEVLSAFVFYANPTVNLEQALPKIKESARLTVKMSKYFFKLAENAENSTTKNSENSLDDLLNFDLMQMQNATDRLIAPKTMPIWEQYLTIIFANITNVTYANISSELILTSKPDIDYLENVVDYVTQMNETDLELFIWWSIVEEMILHTTSDIRKLHNEYAKTVTNLEGTTPRSLYCTGGVNQLMGMAVSYAIAESDFLVNTKPKVTNMLSNIREAFNNLVRETTWMDDGTKCSTLEKSVAMQSLVGFPEWILEAGKLDEYYDYIKLNTSTHLKNMIDILQWEMKDKIQSLYKTEDFGWATTPTNVNAFHTFQANAITIPLAILQYPFYNLGLEALNYGAIGTILGHELTHGFDDSGRMFDKDGNMRQWWTNKTINEYLNRTSCFINQYNNYYLPEVDDHINGELTLGENIADNGGLREAYYAYRLYVRDNGKERMLPGFENYTHEQLLFISFGNLWCETQTATSTQWALEDSHCPGRIRLKGVLQNSFEFTEAFSCKPNSNMYPKNRCRIW